MFIKVKGCDGWLKGGTDIYLKRNTIVAYRTAVDAERKNYLEAMKTDPDIKAPKTIIVTSHHGKEIIWAVIDYVDEVHKKIHS